MGITLGLDVGGSTTKIVAFDQKIIKTLQVRATDQLTSLYGAVGNMLHRLNLRADQIERIVMTGVGASLIREDIYGIPTSKVPEFDAIGQGALLLSGLRRALVISMGTGTAFVLADENEFHHLGGSGVGGGTLIGLSSELFHETDVEAILALAETGDLSHVDLSVADISTAAIPTLPANATAANFGKIKSTATNGDLALGLLNTIFQTAGVLAAFAAIPRDFADIVVTGSLASFPQAEPILQGVGALYGLNFHVPADATFATAIGAAGLMGKLPK